MDDQIDFAQRVADVERLKEQVFWQAISFGQLFNEGSPSTVFAQQQLG